MVVANSLLYVGALTYIATCLVIQQPPSSSIDSAEQLAEAADDKTDVGVSDVKVGTASADGSADRPDNAAENVTHVTDMHKSEKLFVGVISAPHFLQRRAEVRSSWMSGIQQDANGSIGVKFFIGQPDTHLTNMTALKEEMTTYNDIILLPEQDTRTHLAKKTLLFLRWVMHNRGHAEFVFKLDDDSYPHFGRILPLILQHSVPKPGRNRNYVVMGVLHDCEWGSEVERTGRYAEDEKTWKLDVYPKYPQGSGYILSRDLVRALAITHYQKDRHIMLHNEDANIGVWIYRNREVLTDIDWVDIESEIEGCEPDDLISMNLEYGAMSCMWRNHLLGKSDVCCPGYFPSKSLAVSPLKRAVRYTRVRGQALEICD